MEQRDDRDKKGTGDGSVDENLEHLVELLSQWWTRATNELAVLRSVDADLLRKDLWSAIIDAEVLKLDASGARKEFDRVAEAGCHRLILVAIISLFRYRANIEGFWTLAVGPPEQRSRVRQTLNDAADTLSKQIDACGPNFLGA